MSFEHRTLAAGRWATFTFVEQMANIGSEVERALNWQDRGNPSNCHRAYERALELLDLTLEDARNLDRSREIARARESLVDFFQGTNEYASSAALWRKYFGAFGYAARKDT